MKLRLAMLVILLAVILATGGCSTSISTDPEKALDLYGEYELTESGDTSTYITKADIAQDNTITIIVLLESSGMTYEETYWVGSFDPPTTDQEPYTWTSVKDEKAQLQVPDSHFYDVSDLTFTYDSGKLSYTWEAAGEMGDTSSTIILTKVDSE